MEHHLAFVIVFQLCVIFVAGQFSSSFAGPYDITVKALGKCEDEGTREIDFSRTRLARYNRTTYIYNGNFSLPHGFSDNITLSLHIHVYGNGGWKLLQRSHEIGPACSTLKKISPKLLEDIAKAVGTWPHLCPNPPGNYTIKNMPMKIELEAPVLPYNKYMVELSMERKHIRVGCGKIFLDITPKKKSNRKRHG